MRAPSFLHPVGQPATAATIDDVDALAGWITAPDRERPIVVLTAQAGKRDPYFPPAGVQRLVGRDGDVVTIAQSPKGQLTRDLALALPDALMVFNGAARIYWPFSLVGADPDRHPLIRADSDTAPSAEKRARLSNRWRQGPGDTARQAPADGPTPPVAAAAPAPDDLRLQITQAWLALLPTQQERDRFGLQPYRLGAELVKLLEVLEPARTPVAAAAARILSGYVWTRPAPVPERVLENSLPVLRDEDQAVSWRYPLDGGDHVLYYWQPATGPITLARIGTTPRPDRAPAPAAVEQTTAAPRLRAAQVLVADEDLIRVLQAASEPLYVPELRQKLRVPHDVSRQRMSTALNDAIARGVIVKTGQRRGTRYALP